MDFGTLQISLMCLDFGHAHTLLVSIGTQDSNAFDAWPEVLGIGLAT